MTIDSQLTGVIGRFAFPGDVTDCQPVKTGHINATWRVRTTRGDYILQRVNTYVFKQPRAVMQNIALVTEHLSRAFDRQGMDPTNRVLHLVPTREGDAFIEDAAGFWRAYRFVEGARTVDRVDSADEFRQIGSAFGAFQGMLADFPIDKLCDTIPDFHDTKVRLATFERSVTADAVGRAKDVAEEIAFVRDRGPGMCKIVEMIEAGELPLRVTHNDTKINNVMLDARTGEALCVIDLDTVMAGSALYDFGDAIRFGASTADEDETDLTRVGLDLDLFRVFSEGFIRQTAKNLTLKELQNLPLGAMVMTFENGMRFLTDHLDGDVYFHIDRAGQNLDRARCQLQLLRQMEAHREEMNGIVEGLIAEYR